jgi:hypothetical protein
LAQRNAKRSSLEQSRIFPKAFRGNLLLARLTGVEREAGKSVPSSHLLLKLCHLPKRETQRQCLRHFFAEYPTGVVLRTLRMPRRVINVAASPKREIWMLDDNELMELEQKIRLEMASVLFSVLKASCERSIKLTSRSADGTTGPQTLEKCLRIYYMGRSDNRANPNSPLAAFRTDLSQFMAEISAPGHVFDGNAASIAAEVSWYILLSYPLKPRAKKATLENWVHRVSLARGTYSSDLIANRQATYAHVIHEFWQPTKKNSDPDVYADVLKWAEENVSWYEGFVARVMRGRTD